MTCRKIFRPVPRQITMRASLVLGLAGLIMLPGLITACTGSPNGGGRQQSAATPPSSSSSRQHEPVPVQPSGSSPTIAPPPTRAPSQSPVLLGCAKNPHVCGFPDATNTGIPAGTNLRSVPGQVSSGPGWHYDPRGWVEVDHNGAVLEDLSMSLNLDVSASNVTIKHVRIVVTGNSFGVSLRHTHNVTIEDSEIYSPFADANRLMLGVTDIYGDSNGTVVQRNNIWHTSTGVQIYAGLVQDNYIHDSGFRDGDHTNGTTANGGTALLILRHNTVFNAREQTDAISLFEDFGVEANKIIDNNLVAGGGYSIYGGQNPGGPMTFNIQITNNRFSQIYFAHGGHWGYATAFNVGAPGNVWSGNVWDNTGRTIPAP
jgi:hypothetical protein